MSLMFDGAMSAFHMEEENQGSDTQITYNNLNFIHSIYTVMKD